MNIKSEYKKNLEIITNKIKQKVKNEDKNESNNEDFDRYICKFNERSNCDIKNYYRNNYGTFKMNDRERKKMDNRNEKSSTWELKITNRYVNYYINENIEVEGIDLNNFILIEDTIIVCLW